MTTNNPQTDNKPASTKQHIPYRICGVYVTALILIWFLSWVTAEFIVSSYNFR